MIRSRTGRSAVLALTELAQRASAGRSRTVEIAEAAAYRCTVWSRCSRRCGAPASCAVSAA